MSTLFKSVAPTFFKPLQLIAISLFVALSTAAYAGGSAPVDGGSVPDNLIKDIVTAPGTDTESAVMIYGTQAGYSAERTCIDRAASNKVVLWRCDYNKSNQKWFIRSDKSVSAQNDSSQCLTWPSSVGNQIFVSDCDREENQQFIYHESGRITDNSGTICLNMKGVTGRGVSDGTQLISYACHTDSVHWNEQFRALATPNQYVPIVIADGSGRGFASDSDEGRIYITKDTKQIKALWFFEPSPYNDKDVFFIHSAINGKCLDGSSSRRGQAYLYRCRFNEDENNQKWRLIYESDKKRYSIYNLYSGLCLIMLTDDYVVNQGGGENCHLFETGPAPKQMLNVSLVNTNTSGKTNCIGAFYDGVSLVKLDCANRTEILRSAVDILPAANNNMIIRFRATHTCLEDEVYDGTRAKLAGCDSSKRNQRWYMTKTDFNTAFDNPPLWTPMAVGVEYNGSYLSERLTNGQLIISDQTPSDQSKPDSLWKLVPINLGDGRSGGSVCK